MEESRSKYKNLITKSLTLILPAFFLLFWSMLHNSSITSNTKTVFHINNGLLVLTIAVGTFLIAMRDNFKKTVVQVKLEQQNKDFRLLVKYLEIRIKELTTRCGIAEEKTKSLMLKLKYLNQFTVIPDLALYLVEKVINTMEQYKVDLSIHVEGSLDSLKNIQVEDLKQTINMLLAPIYSNFNNIEEEDRREINIFVREQDNKITFKFMHDYIGNPINAEKVEWNMKKLLHKYRANLTVENEREEESDLYVLCLTVDIPKVNKAKKVG